ncbi:MAG: YncE family protein [Gammaproteobacteria bacterium]|nr:YncE family protein [Gammaproteobacteria bacterium]MDD9896619.1 YncE family protein [Gammaproteobacteria bacterium]MDD9958037.1 YncE family protein [Gammaproteobacteria bacterium]
MCPGSTKIRQAILLIFIFLAAEISAQEIASNSGYILATGRRLPYLYGISLDAALEESNNNSPNAIISRNKVALDRLDGQLLGDPANLLLSEDGEIIYVINHHGAIDNGEFLQHGGRGQIAVLEVDAALQSRNNLTENALIRHMDSGGFGAIGAVLLPDMIAINNAENNLTEDGGNRLAFIDRRTGSLRGVVELALGSPGFSCQDYPVPYAAPHGPPRNRAVLAPDSSFGCFPNPNGLARGLASDGREFLFTANGGTNDVSVIDLQSALTGESQSEIRRIPNQVGAWGIAASPDGRYVFVAHGGSQNESRAGNTIAILEVDRVRRGLDPEIARVLVGTDDPQQATHPLIPTVTPDGRELVVPNLRANNVSIVNIERAIAGDANAEVARVSLTRSDGEPARPKGTAISPDGRYAAVSGGAGSRPFSQELGYVYLIDLETREVVSTITGVGNDPYGLTFVYR